jgi:hypothetical protein
MLARSKRPEFHTNTTTADIGPGAYDNADSLGRPLRHAQAPFGSTSTRGAATSSVLDTAPGPGAYFKEVIQPKSIRPSPQFASRQERIPLERSQVESQNLPGPGAYTGDLVTTPRRAPRRPPSGGGMHAAEGINWVKVATAPSIPTVTQSYGYEEGPSGALVLQSGPYKGHTGVGRDTVGPGEYQPTERGVKIARQAPNFGAVAGRSAPVSKDAASRPGPGAYDFAACGTSDAFRGGVMAQRQSSAFASASKRSTMLNSNAPGPGTYRIPSTFAPLAEHLAAHPESFSSFGRTVDDSASRRDAGYLPGPGDYDPSKDITAKNSVKTKALSAMASKTARFVGAEPKNANPGPGSYGITEDTLVSKLGRHINGRFGAFGSTSSRFVPSPSETTTGGAGPGAYNPPAALPNPAETRRKDKRTSNFRSSSMRSDVAPASAATTFYSPKLDWAKPSSTSRAFISNQPRFADSRSTDVPGPGQYDPRRPKHLSAAQGPDFSRASRFGQGQLDALPGPGTYDTTPSMVRRTFNISIGA